MSLPCRKHRLLRPLTLNVFLMWVWLAQATPMLSQETATRNDPSTEPTLRIETGMHTAIIRRISSDDANRFLVTASEDKTVRVWDATSQRLLRILRPPIGEGNEGKVYSVSMSPDGKTIACGGWTAYEWEKSNSVYLFDRESGTMLRRLARHNGVINHLAYSRDGRFLAVCMGGNYGVRVYRTSDYSVVFEDKSYKGASYGADFDEQGRLVTSSDDGFVYLYDAQFKQVAKVRSPAGNDPFHVRFSPNGSKVALGHSDTSSVCIFSGSDLQWLYNASVAGVGKKSFSSVCWSSDGRTLYGAGTHSNTPNKKYIRAWADEGRGKFTDMLTDAGDLLSHLIPRKQGGVFFAAADPGFGAFDANGRLIFYLASATGDFRDGKDNFRVSNDGTIIEFPYEYGGKNLARISILDRLIENISTHSSDVHAPKTNGLNVTNWRNYPDPKLNGKPIKLKQYELARSLAIADDNGSFLLGCSFSLRRIDADGTESWQNNVPGAAWLVNLSKDGNLAVAAFADGSIRWYRYSDGTELLALFPHNDKRRWVISTPNGYYDASSGGENLMGWSINQGKDRAALFFPAAKFHATYYRPDVITKTLELYDVADAVNAANSDIGEKETQASITSLLPPVASILSPADGSEISSTQLVVRYSVRSPSGQPITGVKVLIDGRPIQNTRGLKKVADGSGESLTITVPERDCEIAVIAENQFASSEPATARVVWKSKQLQSQPKDEFVIKPKLYVLSVGVSQYQNKDLTLELASKDAKDFAKSLQAQNGLLYRDVVTKVLTDAEATKDNILDALEWLQKEVTSKDIAMIFFAGHGMNDNAGLFYILPVGADVEKLKRTCLPFSDMKNTVSSLAGKVIVFLDACHSGNAMDGTKRRSATADVVAVVNELSSAENGAVVFSSSTGKQFSLEDAKWGNGAFTKALVEGISGKADLTGRGRITVNMLDVYLSDRVKELTGGKQTPTTNKPPNIPDFPIAIKR